MLNEYVCRFRGVRSICRFILFLVENPLSTQCYPDQMPHYGKSDLGLICLPITLLRFSRKEWVKIFIFYFHRVVGLSRVASNFDLSIPSFL